MVCIAVHLKPEHRISHRRRELLSIIRNLTKTATKLEQLACSIDGTGHVGFLTGLSVAELSDPTDPRTIKYLRGCAANLKHLLTQKAFRDTGGPPRMKAFGALISELARVFQGATGKPAALTHDHYNPSGYSGRFWSFVEIIRLVPAAIIETSGTGSLAQPATEVARGKFIEGVLKDVRTEKTRLASQ
jgi:hypothetical protein